MTFYDSGISIDALFRDDTMQEHVIGATGMWAGSRSPMSSSEFVVMDTPPKILVRSVIYPPALFKCFDEAIVNALDNMVRIGLTGDDNETTRVEINLLKNGSISVLNNGRGVPVGFHEDKQIWSVQRIFGIMFKGRIKNDKESKVTGDANRVGIKIANILSDEFTVETVYTKNPGDIPVKYTQVWSKNMTIVAKPVIENQGRHVRQMTKVTFMPSYKELFDTQWSEEIYNEYEKLFRFRAYTAAAYAGFYSKGRTIVFFNGERIQVQSITDLARLLDPVARIHTTIMSPIDSLSWEVAVVIAENTNTNKKNMQITNVNGVNVKLGRHIDNMMNIVTEGVRERVLVGFKSDIKFQPAYVYTNCSILINCQIPGAEWSGQRKDELVVPISKVSAYIPERKFLDNIAADLKDKILIAIYGKNPVLGLTKKTIKPEKYLGAKNAGTKKSSDCTLLLPEGDSAAGMVTGQIGEMGPDGKALLGWDNYGYLTLGGVIINARRESEVKEIAGKRCIDVHDKLADNKLFSELIEVLGLVPGIDYTNKRDRDTLKYGRVVVCTDQDHDGIGFIYPLVINLFSIFWPHLVETGFVSRWDTPRRRAIPKKGGKIIEFFTERQYIEWKKHANESAYVIDYIKGLASHEPRDQKHMFGRFNNDVVCTVLDTQGDKSLDVMFGSDTGPRKKWLTVDMPPDENEYIIATQRKETVTQLINYQAREHALKNIIQKLWSVVDGMNESGRKVLNGCLKALNKDDKIKVAILAGMIIASEHYQHGEASLQETIVNKALLCVGGVQLPQLIPRAMLGSRRMGGGIKDGDCGAARYVYVSLNYKLTSLIYPAADYPLYEFNYEDGFRVEPKYFIPTIPMAILETIQMPAHGWKIKTWARDVLCTIGRIVFLIDSWVSDETTLKTVIPRLLPYTHGWKGEYRIWRNKTYCCGKYWIDEKERVMHITELPLRVWTQKYCDSIMGAGTKQYHNKTGIQMYTSVSNYSSEANVNIEIYIAPVDKATGLDPLTLITGCADGGFADGFEVYFDLCKSTSPCLSYLDVDNKVIEPDSYEDTLLRWFVIRRRAYTLRLTRDIILLKADIRVRENIERYINLYDTIIPQKATEETAIQILTENAFDRAIPSRTKGMIGQEYIKTEEIFYHSFEVPEATFDYLLSTTDRDRLAGPRKKRGIELIELKRKLIELETLSPVDRFLGASVWKQELREIVEIVKQGRECNWDFTKGKYDY